MYSKSGLTGSMKYLDLLSQLPAGSSIEDVHTEEGIECVMRSPLVGGSTFSTVWLKLKVTESDTKWFILLRDRI